MERRVILPERYKLSALQFKATCRGASVLGVCNLSFMSLGGFGLSMQISLGESSRKVLLRFGGQ